MSISYDRNRPYISPRQQLELARMRILLAGAGLGSVLAETALRTGFRRFRIADRDWVEDTNLNRQNYTSEDLDNPKTLAVGRRLAAIDPHAEVETRQGLITGAEIADLMDGVDVVVNCLDFDTDAPELLDAYARERGIPTVHPFNLAWAGACALFTPESPTMAESFGTGDHLIVRLLAAVGEQESKAGRDDLGWAIDAWYRFLKSDMKSYPQPRVGAELCCAIACRIMVALALGEPVRPFPYIHVCSVYSLT